MKTLSAEAWAVLEARSHDPFAWLGRHQSSGEGVVVRAFKLRAENMWLLPSKGKAIPMPRIEGTDFFELLWQGGDFASAYRFRIENHDAHKWEEEDPYRFGTMLGEMDLHLIGEGNHFEKYKLMGAHVREHEGVAGVGFAV